MSVKVTTRIEKTEERKPFPKLMIFKDRSFIFLFSDKAKGVCVHSTHEDWKVGDYDDNLDHLKFLDFNEPITLQNE